MTSLQMPARTATGDGSRWRWPLLAIGASAGTATWSGWVGLGQLTGFGVVHPLPGIADGFTINTAVTLPIGVEAYAMYALSIATSNRALPVKVRRYAWASSAAALLLGMAGQVAYHVMTAAHPLTLNGRPAELAPWQVIALVSCLPVLVLGAASLLWHLAGAADPSGIADQPDQPDQPGQAGPVETGGVPAPAGDSEPEAEHGPAAALRPARPDDLARLRDAITARHPDDPDDRAATEGRTPVAAHGVARRNVARADVAERPGVAVPGTLPPDRLAVLFPLTSGHQGNEPASAHPEQRDAPTRPPSATRRRARPSDLARLRSEIAAGRLPAHPTVRDVAAQLAISWAHAAAARRAVTAEQIAAQPASETTEQHSPATEHQPEQRPEHPAEESNSALTKKASH